MSRLRKCFIHKTLVEVCFRTEEGLPFVATSYMKLVFIGILAKAQTLYPVTICGFVLMANHMHMLIVVKDPADVDDFVGYIKRESAHAVNHFLGRKKHTIWCDGYDSPTILDADKAIDRFVHLYTNPQNANLVERIEDYPNLSSWNSFSMGQRSYTCKRVYRDEIRKLPEGRLSLQEQELLAQTLAANSPEVNELTIDPNAWMPCFNEISGTEAKDVNAILLERIRAEEERLICERGNKVIGCTALETASMSKTYSPSKRSKRTACMSSFRDYRVRFLAWYRGLCNQASETYKEWVKGDFSTYLPPGMFVPGGVLYCNVNPAFAPI